MRRMPDYAWVALGALATLLILRPWERK
jgi:hypothetical protein